MVYLKVQRICSVAIIACLIGVVATQRTCYFPSGATHSLGLPCNPNTESASSCCESTHVCLSNSLCLDTLNNHVVRGSCTDDTFEDGACAQYCIEGPESARLGDMRQCNGQNNNWTCGMDVTDCQNPFTISSPSKVDDRRNSTVNNVIHPIGDAASQTNPSSTSPTSTTSTTSSPSMTSSTPVQDNDSSTKTLNVALGVGLGVGLPLLVVLILSLWFLRKTKQQLADVKSRGSIDSHQRSIPQQDPTGYGHPFYPFRENSVSPGAAPSFQQQLFRPQESASPRELEGHLAPAELTSTHAYEAA